MSFRKLIVSCGGTGGHFYPGLSVAREFRKQGGEVLLLLGGKHADTQKKTAESFGIRAEKISAMPFSLKPLPLIRFKWAVFRGVFQCLRLFHSFRPDAVLSMGSFASFPPVIAAVLSRKPLFLHDGNVRLGKANLRMAPLARALAISFPTSDSERCGCPVVLTGMPLRPELLQDIPSHEKALDLINQRWNCSFRKDVPTVLIFGGSLGAENINKSCRIPHGTPENELQLIHLTGLGKQEEIRAFYEGASFRRLLLETASEMNWFYAAADWVVCRAGGSTVSELACFGKYAVLVPYPFAVQDHQTENARYLTSSGGAELIPDRELTEERFVSKLQDFLKNPDEYREKGLRLKALAFPEASANVLKMIDNILTASRG